MKIQKIDTSIFQRLRPYVYLGVPGAASTSIMLPSTDRSWNAILAETQSDAGPPEPKPQTNGKGKRKEMASPSKHSAGKPKKKPRKVQMKNVAATGALASANSASQSKPALAGVMGPPE